MRKLLNSMLFVISLLLVTSINSQTISEFKIKDRSTGTNQLKKKPKKIFVNDFVVHYQFYNQKEKTSKGGMLGNVLKGDAKSKLFLGLDNLTEQDFKDITDELFSDFKSQLDQKGYEFVDGKNYENTDAFKGRERIENYPVDYNVFPGVASVHPSDYAFYSSNENFLKMNYSSKLSKDLEDAVVANVTLFVFFIEDKNSWSQKNKSANIKVETQLRIVAYDNVKAINEKEVSKLRALTIGKKKQVDISAQSQIEFTCGRNPIGGSPDVSYIGNLKNDITIEGAFVNTTIKNEAKNDEDYIGTETAFGKVYRAQNITVANSYILPVDAEEYKKGVVKGGKAFIKAHIQNILD
ncbi:hypothetical protein NHF50_10315 [Flavobacterium sp. NRK F10]|uniref:hypothetical protein n=1 Tax=Flavobacterium sp. NRK F10 TaxID=2954931 RepID=UPI00209080C0|nr:hypothetical protein [Flavobacterium sp. NRK F10]MCO6175436.1 hypothetical protein [Flavobacterium sp. NRK F10]